MCKFLPAAIKIPSIHGNSESKAPTASPWDRLKTHQYNQMSILCEAIHLK